MQVFKRRPKEDEFPLGSVPQNSSNSSRNARNRSDAQDTKMYDQMPFTPPPYYVRPSQLFPPGSLPRPIAVAVTADTALPALPSFSQPRRQRSPSPSPSGQSFTSNSIQQSPRSAQSAKKKHRPGLSINTNVAKSNRPTPREIPAELSRETSSAATNSRAANLQPTIIDPSWNFNSTNKDNRLTSIILPPTYITPSPELFRPSRPTKRVASSVYSRATRATFSQIGPDGGNWTRRGSRGQYNVRDSTATAFEEDDNSNLRNARADSADTMFEEEGSTAVATSAVPAAYSSTTPTPRRSRGWWNVITTPFEGTKPVSQFYTATPNGGQTPEVPPLPTTIPVYRNQSGKTIGSQKFKRGRSRQQSTASSSTSILSPGDREVPIVLGIYMEGTSERPVVPAQSSNGNTTAAAKEIGGNLAVSQNRVPFSSPGSGATPPSGIEEFSPAGQITGIGIVPAARGVVQNASQPETRTPTPIQRSLNTSQESRPSSVRSSLVAQVVRMSLPAQPLGAAFKPEQRRAGLLLKGHYGHYKEIETDMEPMFAPPPGSIRNEKLKSPKEKKKSLNGFMCCGKKRKDGKKKSKRRRQCCICCFCFVVMILVLLILLITLAVVLSRKRKATAAMSAPTWVNITNFPGVPTGILTVARPNLVSSNSNCVTPKTMWSCAVPKEQQASIAPNAPNQPNFAIDIRYINSTSSGTGTLQMSKFATSGPAKASYMVKRLALGVVNAVDSTLFPASPSPPTIDEQQFLGNTTDHNTSPFEGEDTPFVISFQPPGSTPPTKVKRDIASSATQSANVFPNFVTAIPIPSLNPDGTALAASLLPFPSYQPLRLYNRGRDDEHLGFYTYYDRTIFLRSIQTQNATDPPIPADTNGGSTFSGATSSCTWRETRFLVQIWTRKNGTGAHLLPHASGSGSRGLPDLVQPGSFPYPVTITLDRHGGGLQTKMLYCYQLDERGHVNITNRAFHMEDRAANGMLVNPAQGPFVSVSVTPADGGPGGIDGGSGGCGCQWANWVAK